MLTRCGSSETTISSIVQDGFGVKGQDVVPKTAQQYVLPLIIGRLKTYGTTLEPSYRTKHMEPGAIFGRFDD